MVYGLNGIRNAGKELTDMTAFTAPCQVLVDRGKKRGRGKRIGRIVAYTAFSQRWYMIHYLGRRNSSVMTLRAVIIIYTQMVKSNTDKRIEFIDRVTGRAIQRRRQVINGLADADVTIMA